MIKEDINMLNQEGDSYNLPTEYNQLIDRYNLGKTRLCIYLFYMLSLIFTLANAHSTFLDIIVHAFNFVLFVLILMEACTKPNRIHAIIKLVLLKLRFLLPMLERVDKPAN